MIFLPDVLVNVSDVAFLLLPEDEDAAGGEATADHRGRHIVGDPMRGGCGDDVYPRGVDRVVPAHLRHLVVAFLAVPQFDEEVHHRIVAEIEEGTEFTRDEGERRHRPEFAAELELFLGGREHLRKALGGDCVWAELDRWHLLKEIEAYVDSSRLRDDPWAGDEDDVE